MCASRVSREFYTVKQIGPKLTWKVVIVGERVGRAMEKRNEPYLYYSAAEASIVKKQLNLMDKV